MCLYLSLVKNINYRPLFIDFKTLMQAYGNSCLLLEHNAQYSWANNHSDMNKNGLCKLTLILCKWGILNFVFSVFLSDRTSDVL